MAINVLESYLVSLGFSVDTPALQQFKGMMEDAQRSVETHATGMTKRIVEWQGAAIGAFTSVSGAIVGMIDKVAMADLNYTLMGQKMMLSVGQARSLDMITKALGADLGQITWSPELHKHAVELQQDMKGLMTPAAGFSDYEAKMLKIRDLRFEFTKLELAAKFLGMSFVSKLFDKLNVGDIGARLKGLTDWFNKVVASGGLADKLATYAVPILKETWKIFKDLGEIVKEGAIAFSNIIGLLSGDTAIEGSTFKIQNMATAIEHVTHMLESMLNAFLNAEKAVAHTTAAMSMLLHGDLHGAGGEMHQAVHGEPVKDKDGNPVLDAEGKPKTEGGLGVGPDIALAIGGLWAGKKILNIGKGIGRFFGFGKTIGESTPKELVSELAKLMGKSGAAEVGAAGGEVAAGSGAAAEVGAGAAAAEGGGLLSVLGPIGVALGVIAGGDWLATKLSPKFKEWQQQSIFDPISRFFGGNPTDAVPDAIPAPAVPAPTQTQTPAPISFFGGNPAPTGGSGVPAVRGVPDAKPSPYGPLVDKLAAAIEWKESGGNPNARDFRNNNPANLRTWGDMPIVNGFAKFPTLEAGRDAEFKQIARHMDLSLTEFFAGQRDASGNVIHGGYSGFAPKKDNNDPRAYANDLAKWLGVDPNVPIQRYVGDHDIEARANVRGPDIAAYMNRPTAATAAHIAYNNQTVNLSLGGIYITQPNADPQQIQKAVAEGGRKLVERQSQLTLLQLTPAWG